MRKTKDFKTTAQIYLNNDDRKQDYLNLHEKTEVYKKNTNDNFYDVNENTDLYKKSGIKLIKRIKIDF